MNELRLDLGNRSYGIIIGQSVLDRAGEFIARLPVGRKVLIVTDNTVGHLYAERVYHSLTEAGLEPVLVQFASGEEQKTLANAYIIYDHAFSEGLDRHSVMVALGGGVIGDLTGFAAATYMRGVPFVQLPTTLLAQVDSSVGGKVAVNHPRGKNIIGAFYQPSLVLADTDVLATLETRELYSGLAEIIKYGVIGDAEFFTWLEDNLLSMLALEPKALAKAIKQSCLSKARLVEKDETEQGVRALLNFGHTTGHAIETLAGYGRYTHGEAVAMGSVVAAQLGVLMELISQAEADRITGLLRRANLPVRVPDFLSDKELIQAMYGDKKTVNGSITFIAPAAIGRAVIRNGIEDDLIRKAIEAVR